MPHLPIFKTAADEHIYDLQQEIKQLKKELGEARGVCQSAADYLDTNRLTNIGHGSILHKQLRAQAK